MFKKLSRILLPVFCAALLIPTALSLNVKAEDISSETEYVEPETEYVPPETEYVPPETEYVPPETEYIPPETQYVEPETQYVEPETQYVQPTTDFRQEYVQLIDSAEEPTGFIAPQIDKSVSNKTYSTDYTAGIVSWICVGVGLIVIIIMLVSTKIMGARAPQKRI